MNNASNKLPFDDSQKGASPEVEQASRRRASDFSSVKSSERQKRNSSNPDGNIVGAAAANHLVSFDEKHQPPDTSHLEKTSDPSITDALTKSPISSISEGGGTHDIALDELGYVDVEVWPTQSEILVCADSPAAGQQRASGANFSHISQRIKDKMSSSSKTIKSKIQTSSSNVKAKIQTSSSNVRQSVVAASGKLKGTAVSMKDSIKDGAALVKDSINMVIEDSNFKMPRKSAINEKSKVATDNNSQGEATQEVLEATQEVLEVPEVREAESDEESLNSSVGSAIEIEIKETTQHSVVGDPAAKGGTIVQPPSSAPESNVHRPPTENVFLNPVAMPEGWPSFSNQKTVDLFAALLGSSIASSSDKSEDRTSVATDKLMHSKEPSTAPSKAPPLPDVSEGKAVDNACTPKGRPKNKRPSQEKLRAIHTPMSSCTCVADP